MIAFVVAKAANNVIGNHNELPWYLPADLKHFKALTLGHTVIMGRKTYESIINRLHGPLPDRHNIVVSSSLRDVPEGFELAPSLDDALQCNTATDTVFVIGGATLYKACLENNKVDVIYLTEIPVEIPGDVYFPELDKSQWVETERETHGKDDKNQFDYSFITLKRIQQ